VKSKPDFVLMLAAAFALGVVLTMLLPLAANDSVAEPVSELQAGVIIPR
jgi:acyl-CoA synthetase (AMP-forming)/AMP-acid ligase II